MYEARQNKEKVSRRVNIDGSGIRQRIKMDDRRIITVLQKMPKSEINQYFKKEEKRFLTIQKKCTIEVENTNTKSKATGESNSYKPSRYDDLLAIFKNVEPVLIRNKDRGSYMRQPYFCAEPHALFNLWEIDRRKVNKTKKKKMNEWLKNIVFNKYAYSLETGKYLRPCCVCSQWLNRDLPMKIKNI